MEVVRELQKGCLKWKPFGKTKKKILYQILPIKSCPVGSSLYGFHGKVIMLSRVPKKSQAVVLLSIHHANSLNK